MHHFWAVGFHAYLKPHYESTVAQKLGKTMKLISECFIFWKNSAVKYACIFLQNLSSWVSFPICKVGNEKGVIIIPSLCVFSSACKIPVPSSIRCRLHFEHVRMCPPIRKKEKWVTLKNGQKSIMCPLLFPGSNSHTPTSIQYKKCLPKCGFLANFRGLFARVTSYDKNKADYAHLPHF